MNDRRSANRTTFNSPKPPLVRVGLTDLLADLLRFIDLSDAEPLSIRRLTIRRHHSFSFRLQTPPTIISPVSDQTELCLLFVVEWPSSIKLRERQSRRGKRKKKFITILVPSSNISVAHFGPFGIYFGRAFSR